MKTLDIPKGSCLEDIKTRRSVIKRYLCKYKNKRYYCPCLGVHVVVTANSIAEIAYHAGVGYESTLSALSLIDLLQCANYCGMTLPKRNGRQNKMGIIFMYELRAETKYGWCAKITVGVRLDRNEKATFLQYCVTCM